MANLKKLTGITGLNTSHALYSSVYSLINFEDVIKDVKSNTVYTSTSTVIEDPDLGFCRVFDAVSDILSPNLPIPFNSTVVLIYKPTGVNTAGSASVAYYLGLNSGGNALIFEAANYTGYDYRISLRGSAGTTYTITYVPYKTNGSTGVISNQAVILDLKNRAHATAFDFTSGNGKPIYQNGVQVPVYGQSATPSFTPSVDPVSVPVANTLATTAAQYMMSAIIVFNRTLTDAEKAEVTNNPWNLVAGALPLEVTLSEVLSPNSLITATLTNFTIAPTTTTISDVRGNYITLPLTSIGGNQYTFSVPDLATDAAGKPYIQNGIVSLTFGAKTINSDFIAGGSREYVTLISPVATNAFQAWGTDVPVVGEQLISLGNFDVYGNFTGGDPNATYDCWITRLDGSNHYFTIRQGTASPPTPSTSGRYNLLFDPIQDCLDSVSI